MLKDSEISVRSRENNFILWQNRKIENEISLQETTVMKKSSLVTLKNSKEECQERRSNGVTTKVVKIEILEISNLLVQFVITVWIEFCSTATHVVWMIRKSPWNTDKILHKTVLLCGQTVLHRFCNGPVLKTP